MAQNYYTLVAGLREFSLDSDKKGFDAGAIVDEIRGELGKKDRNYLELFYNYYDIENIVNIVAGRSHFSTLGNYSREELEGEIKNPEKLPPYMSKILAAYAEPDNPEWDEVDLSKAIEKSLFEAYYDRCAKSGCRFLKEWGEFDRNLRNLTAAYTARRLGLPVADQLVGGGDVAEALGRSSAADFGLAGELDYIDEVMQAVSAEGNLLEKERRIDMVRWEMSDELTQFDYFNINTILAYLVKINIIHRWVSLDADFGRQMFDRLMESFSGRELIEQAENIN